MPFPDSLLWYEILEAIYKYLLPNTDLDHILGKIYNATSYANEQFALPPERVRLLVKRYMEYPEFYSVFAERQFAKLPEGNDLALAIMQENDVLFGLLDMVPAQLTRTTRFPLPEWVFADQDTLADVLHTFDLQLDFLTSLYPVNASVDFEAYYMAVSSVVPRMLAAYHIDQVSRLFP